MSIITPAQKRQYDTEGFMILPSVIPKDKLEMMREQCSYYLGYFDSILDAEGVESDGFNHREKRYFIANRYRLSACLWEFIFGPNKSLIERSKPGGVGLRSQPFQRYNLIQSTSAVVGAELGVKGPAQPGALEAQMVKRMVCGRRRRSMFLVQVLKRTPSAR